MPKIGADIQQMSSLTSSFNKQSAQVDALISAINGQLGALWWEGPAAAKFRDQWTSQFVPNLRSLSEALRAAGSDVENRRQRIEAAGS
ncbi:MAG: WXG100 family type VII secretion target [Candidatus Limnocylindrales bacterium]